MAIPEAPPAAAAGGGAAGASKHASRRIQTGLLERLFGDNVMDLLLLLAQHSQQVHLRARGGVCGGWDSQVRFWLVVVACWAERRKGMDRWCRRGRARM